MTSTITQVDPLYLHQKWPFILRGLQSVIHKAKTTKWWPEDVYAAIQHRTAAAYIVSCGAVPVGFFVVHPQQVPFSGETELFLWIMWRLPLRESREFNMDAVTLDTLRFIAALALQNGHSAVSTLTVRKGLIRAYPNLWRSEVIPCRMTVDTMTNLVNGAH